MPVPITIADLSATPSLNSPQGSETVTISVGPDEYMRAHAAIIRTLSDDTTTALATKALLGGSGTQAFSASTFTGAGTGLTGTAAELSVGGNAATATTATTAVALQYGTSTAHELGRYLDLHGGTGAAVDYDVRLDSGPGTGAVSGGTLTVIAQGGVTADRFNGNATTATTAANALGQGQTLQDVTASRAAATTYTNSSGRTIVVMVVVQIGAGAYGIAHINGVERWSTFAQSSATRATATLIVKAGDTYILASGAVISWHELRT